MTWLAMAFIALVSPWANPPNPSMGDPPTPAPPPPPAGGRGGGAPPAPPAAVFSPGARLAVLCRPNHRPSRRLIHRLIHRLIRSCWVAYSRDRHRCRCRSPLHRLRRPNSCVGPVLVGAPPRADSDSPGSAWTAPRADPVHGSGSAREGSTAAPGSPAEEARDGSAAAVGVSVAAPRFGLPPRKIRMAAPHPGQRSRSLRHPGWGIFGSRGRRSLPRCPGYPS